MRQIFIEKRNSILRIAVKEGNKLKECFIEEESPSPLPEQIYKGVISNIVPAIKCAFIDIGEEKKCYMYLDKKFDNLNLKKGSEVLVQVVKEELGSKGAKVTSAISIPGRYCVLETLNKGITFSKKIMNDEFKSKVLKELKRFEDVGIILRTLSEGVDINILNTEIDELYEKYSFVKNKYLYSLKPGLIYDNGGIIAKTLRDKLQYEGCKVYSDNEEDYSYIKKYIEKNEIKNTEVIYYNEHRGLFDYFGIEKEILALRNHKVYLKCGGYIIIDRTEAMYVIDVNSGKNVNSMSMEKTALITNLQAAEETANQILLRNLSGIIVIDFIDMTEESHKEMILSKLKEVFEKDKNKTVIYPFTELNLVQISRRRFGKSIYDYIEEDCDKCSGKGKRLKFSYVCMLIKDEIRKKSTESINNIHIQINNIYEKEIKDDILSFIEQIDGFNKNIYLSYISGNEYFKVEALLFQNQIEALKEYKIYG